MEYRKTDKMSKDARSSSKKRSGTNKSSKQKNNRSLSHAMSWALRHAAPELGLTMTPDGYVPVIDLLHCGNARFRGYTEEDVRQVVETSDKQRYKLCQRRAEEFGVADGNEMVLCVRANQGHSISNIDADKLLTRISPEELGQLETVVHGTFWDAWRSGIEKQGLFRMTRNHIHFATGMPEEDHVISGMRKSCDVYIYVDAAKCAREGVEFFKSDNGVLLTAGVDNQGILPPEFFSRVISSSGEVLLDGTGSK